MLPQKIFENLHTAMAILVLFNNFEGKFVIFLAPYTVKKVRKFYRCFTSIMYELQKLTTGNFIYVSFM